MTEINLKLCNTDGPVYCWEARNYFLLFYWNTQCKVLKFSYINLLNPTGHVICHQEFNIQQFYVLPTHFFVCFVWIWIKTAIISLCNSNWLVFITDFTLFTPVVTIRTASLTFHNSTLCPHCIYVFCIYLRRNSDLWHLQHKEIGFYNRDEKCFQRGTDWGFK